MSPRRQQQEPGRTTDPAEVTWVAAADLYPPLGGPAAAVPVPAYRAGMRVPWADVERHGWQDRVRDEREKPAPQPDTAAAAAAVHPVIAAGLETAQPDPLPDAGQAEDTSDSGGGEEPDAGEEA